jgi:hypothetical protein
MARALRGQRAFWAVASAVFILFAYFVVAENQSAATVPAPHSCFDAVETVSGNIGTNGDDVMIGTSGPDVMHGRGGNDLICGGGGGDTLYGEGGGDRLKGEAGPDKLYGGIGNDHLVPNDGDLVVDGQDGRDCTPSGLGTSIEYACPNQTQQTTTSSTTTTTLCVLPGNPCA